MELWAGLQKTSLIDYPGRLAAVAFLPGCNFACPYCHNPELAALEDLGEGLGGQPRAGLVPWSSVLEHLKKRRNVLSGLVFSGGEPCMHGELPSLADEVRALGYAVKLDTNGSLPEAISPVSPDYIAMDIKTSLSRYPDLACGELPDLSAIIPRSMSVIRALGCAYEFRITCAPGIFGPAEAEALLPYFEARDQVVLQAYRPGRVLDTAWAERVGVYAPSALEELLALVRKAAPKARLRGG